MLQSLQFFSWILISNSFIIVVYFTSSIGPLVLIAKKLTSFIISPKNLLICKPESLQKGTILKGWRCSISHTLPPRHRVRSYLTANSGCKFKFLSQGGFPIEVKTKMIYLICYLFVFMILSCINKMATNYKIS